MDAFLSNTFLGNSVENYLWFLGVITLVLVCNRFISKGLGFLLYKIFRRFSAKDLSQQFIKLLLKPIKTLVLLLAIYFSFAILDYPELLNFSFYGLEIKLILHRIMFMILTLVLTWMALRIINFISIVMMKKAEETESKMDDQLIPFIKDFLKVIIVIFCIFFILGSILKLNVNSLLAGIGIGGIAIALAAQSSVENLLGSFTIFFDKPFSVGDFVQIGEIVGTVEKVGFRSTRIRTIYKSYVTLPNKLVAESILDNLTMRTFRRVRSMVSLTYDTSKEQIEAIVKDIQKYLDDHPHTNQDGVVGFHEFGDSSLDILVQYFADHSEWKTFVTLKEDINFTIMSIVKKHGSDFAFPTRTVYMTEDQDDK